MPGLIDLTGAELAPLSWLSLRERCYGRRRGVADDLFCGMGGMAAAALLAGGEVNFSANHNRKAYLAHGVNFGHIEHLLGDLSVLDPSRMFGQADVLLASPECRRHSPMGNWRTAIAELSPWDPDREAERSRCTMWCPQRLAAYRGYEYIILENIVEVVKWNQFHNWLAGWSIAPLDYVVEQICFNAAFFGAPQSRDRIAFVIRRRGAPRPNLDFRPRCYCWQCERQVFGVQTWKPQAIRNQTPIGPVGKFGNRGQYLYCCPACATVACPLIIPARAAVNPEIPAVRIADREKELAPKTMARLRIGWEQRGTVSQLVTIDGRTPGSKLTRPIWLPAMTQTTRQEIGLFGAQLVVPLRNNGVARETAIEPAQALCAGGCHHAIVGPDQEGAVARDIDTDPIATITTAGNHFVVGANRTSNVPRDANMNPAATVTTAEGGSLFAVQPSNRDMLVQTGGNTYERPGSDYVRAWSLDAVSPTQSTSLERGVLHEPRGESLIVPPGCNSDLRDVDTEPAPTQVTTVRPSLLEHVPIRDRDYAVPREEYLAGYYSNHGPLRSIREPAGTQTATDHHALLSAAQPADRAAGERGGDGHDIALEDCTFRMLVVKEAQALMDLSVRPDGEAYRTVEIDGINNSDAVRLAGNAVCQTQFANLIHRVFLAREGTLRSAEYEDRWRTLPKRR